MSYRDKSRIQLHCVWSNGIYMDVSMNGWDEKKI